MAVTTQKDSFRKNKHGLRTNPKLKGLLPPLGKEEKSGLRQLLAKRGRVDDPIVVWRATNEIVDGHHRYEAAEDLKIPYDITFMDFKDEAEVVSWMVSLQCSRRNLGKAERDAVAMRLHDMIAVKAPAGRHKSQIVAEQVAKIVGESPQQVRNRLLTNKNVGKLIAPIQKQYKSGEQKISTPVLSRLSKLPEHEQARVYEGVKSGKHATYFDAMDAYFPKNGHTRKKKAETNGHSADPLDEVLGDKPLVLPPRPGSGKKKTGAEAKADFKAVLAIFGQYVRAVDELSKWVPHFDSIPDKLRRLQDDEIEHLNRWQELAASL